MKRLASMSIATLVVVILVATVVAAGGNEEPLMVEDTGRMVLILISVLFSMFPEEFGFKEQASSSPASPAIKRSRRLVSHIMKELGPTYTKRAYRMSEDSFFKLHRILWKYLNRPRSEKKKSKNGSKNGIVTTTVRLSIALRYFAGGRPEDIAVVHGVSHSEVFRSIWRVVDAILACEELSFEFPSDHNKQRQLAGGFQRKSQPQFDCCVAAIDGMLLWMEKPSPGECDRAGCGAKKFFCGRKHKFGLNLQGTCDSECRFLDVCIKHPASTSDFLSFTTSALYRKLEQKDFIAPGLCLFGDAAYTNGRYFATPYKNVSSGTKDDYNFYHSQLRIRIECTFGQLVSRWGILRRALPARMGIMKMTHLVKCLCQLHNYCINERLAGTEDIQTPRPLATDNLEIITNGGIAFAEANRDGQSQRQELPEELLGAGHHNDDTSRQFRRMFERSNRNKDEVLPRDRLHSIVAAGEFKRPTPKKWKK